MNKDIINKFIFNTINKKDNSMKTIDKPTRLRFVKDGEVWRTRPVYTPAGYRFVEITRPTGYDNFVYTVFTYPENEVITTGEAGNFNELKLIAKDKLRELGVTFSDEIRKRVA